ncbi:MAG TPA: AAA family ATPase, partial [Thermoanaerobaculia bacterium]|nr:AAA family ATPase [Thermoanaerobaculia bacterium]
HLVRALRERLSDGMAQWVSCYGSPYARNSPLHPVVGLLRRAIEKIDRESPLDQLERFLDQHALQDALPLFAPLLGIPFDNREDYVPLPPERQREKTLDALVALTLDMAEQQPLVLSIEDLHWLDPTTIGWLDRLIDQAPSVPLFLVMTVRLQTLEMQWGPRAHLTSITLGPLSGGEAERLVDRVIDWAAGGKPLAESLRRQIVARTDGVPLFLEELTRAVLESAESGETRELPATLRDSLTARLDRLGAAKEVAQLAAVIGRSFSLELLAAVSPIPEAALQRELRHLVQAELIYRRGFGNQTRYFFKHALVQDAAYESLLKKEQQQIHLRIAEAIASGFPEIAAEQPEVLAHHFSEGNDARRAVPYWHEAGQKALARFANAEAIHHLERGQSLLQRLPPGPERDGQDLRFQGALVPAIIATQGFGSPAVERAFQRGIELCERLGAPSFQLLWGLFGFYSVCREPAKALEVGRQMLQIAEAENSIPYKVQSHYGLGGTCFPDGNLHESLEHIRTALSYDEPDIGRTLILTFGSDDRKVAAAYQGPLLWLLGSPAEALERSRAAIAWAREEPSPFTLSTVLLLSCFLHLFRKEELIVQAYAEEMIHLCEEHNLFQIRDANVMLGCAQVETPDGEEWIPRLRESIEIYRASGFQVFLTFYLAQLAAACLRFGRFMECEAALQEAIRLSEDNQELFWAAEIHRLAGDLALTRAEPRERAEGAYRRALEIAARQSARSLELRAATSLARLWARLWNGERESGRARDLLAEALQGFSEGQETADVREAAAVLSALA